MLTNEANFVLHHFYKLYKDRLDEGYSEEMARYFYDDEQVHHDYFLGFNFDDFVTYTKELSSNEYVTLGYGDGGFAELIINPKAIIEIENLYKNNAKKFINALIDLKKLVGA
ncbi:hypothetical protein [Staphylococcus agnetis]|uniref:Phage protein n=1 Tax=Staphylococcus agnetis TaxID=985762 RepID=A0ABD7TRA9_9STAP|nr:hypothetical protein [Staphylococcus agnetis]UXU56538.1 hypothetical protein MUA95_08160 [Staphylococcus agnetis]UXU58858.1 hypothetical protein MUA97_08165 [Staphylococcus agnetis]UXU61183.1 hypothetical protein MUA43_08165 [Staphylococcus agnetis]